MQTARSTVAARPTRICGYIRGSSMLQFRLAEVRRVPVIGDQRESESGTATRRPGHHCCNRHILRTVRTIRAKLQRDFTQIEQEEESWVKWSEPGW